MLELGQVDKTADTPAFKQIAQAIREAVSSGRLSLGIRCRLRRSSWSSSASLG